MLPLADIMLSTTRKPRIEESSLSYLGSDYLISSARLASDVLAVADGIPQRFVQNLFLEEGNSNVVISHQFRILEAPFEAAYVCRSKRRDCEMTSAKS